MTPEDEHEFYSHEENQRPVGPGRRRRKTHRYVLVTKGLTDQQAAELYDLLIGSAEGIGYDEMHLESNVPKGVKLQTPDVKYRSTKASRKALLDT